jgi:hydrogenase maturation protein HypF
VLHRRAAIEIHGTVQGVGFRPFVYRLARDLDLTGWVRNDADGVFIEVEGPVVRVERFLDRLTFELPTVAAIDELDIDWNEPRGAVGFEILHSEASGEPTAVILPDLATCVDCMGDVDDPTDRRFRYPFTNCTNCGPRFSIIRALPYDRPNTTMASFTMCDACRAEYGDPLDRRFHAQPTACPECGPRLAWREGDGASVTEGHDALTRAVATIEEGGVLAVKGIGGFQLVADATDTDAVERLRARKHRPTKPFAVMVADVGQADAIAGVTEDEARTLRSPQAPIVLLPRRDEGALSPLVAPDNPLVGVMLPTTPLHHLLVREVGVPIVVTSGNLTDEPICVDEHEAMSRFAGIADGYLVHDRPIERHVDDSVARTIDGAIRTVRRARGYAPLPIALPEAAPPIVAVGAHLKNTVAVTVGRNVFVSQHIGDLETREAEAAFERVLEDLMRMYRVTPEIVAHDLHPAYLSTVHATTDAAFASATRIPVQHHHAHLVSCLVDNAHPGPALGVTWDGTGHGTDGTVWGGEFLLGDAAGFRRVGHLLPFRLPGGEAAIREPRRSAASALHTAGVPLDPRQPGLESFSSADLAIIRRVLERGLNAPVTTSAGRLFDAVAAILGLSARSTFEGEAAMALEHVAVATTDRYPIPLEASAAADDGVRVLDWRPMIHAITDDVDDGVDIGDIAGRFHASLARGIVDVAVSVGHPVVALTGGCFQNRMLTEATAGALRTAGFEVLIHRRIPPNDGGISIGQAAVAAAAVGSTSLGQ